MAIIKCECGISYNETNKRHLTSKSHKEGIQKRDVDITINKVVEFIKTNSKMFKNANKNNNIKQILVENKVIDKDDDILITTIEARSGSDSSDSDSSDDSSDSCADSDITYEPSDDEEGDVENA
jgi:hypothetical protein